MSNRIATCTIASAALVSGCSASDVDSTIGTSSNPLEIRTIDSLCVGTPETLRGQSATQLDLGMPSYAAPARIFVTPASPTPSDNITVVAQTPDEQPIASKLTVRIRYTIDGWRSFANRDLSELCSDALGRRTYFVSLGPQPSGTQLAFALYYEKYEGPGLPPRTGWLNRGGENFLIAVQDPPQLKWVGDSRLAQAGVFANDDRVVAYQPLQVYTQTNPLGAASEVFLHVADASYASTETIVMALSAHGIGPAGANAEWVATIPPNRLKPAQELRYWVRALDHQGNEKWDSNNGLNYAVVPKALATGSIGAFGAYRPSSGDFVTPSSLFNRDLSTSIGCWNHGASVTSYLARAVRVHVPGLTDRDAPSPEEVSRLAALLQVEAVSNASRGRSWTVYPAHFATQTGADFAYTFFEYSALCGGSEDASRGIADGDYEYAVRVSSDGGRTWSWRRGENGQNLKVRFSCDCSYFNDPADCISRPQSPSH